MRDDHKEPYNRPVSYALGQSTEPVSRSNDYGYKKNKQLNARLESVMGGGVKKKKNNGSPSKDYPVSHLVSALVVTWDEKWFCLLCSVCTCVLCVYACVVCRSTVLRNPTT